MSNERRNYMQPRDARSVNGNVRPSLLIDSLVVGRIVCIVTSHGHVVRRVTTLPIDGNNARGREAYRDVCRTHI